MSSVWMQPKLDKLWRDGLFYKLMPRTEAGVWRILHQYYDESFAVVNVEGFRSSAFKIDEGIKQGGILSSFLFNFFLDDLLNRLLSMNIGALLGDVNASAIAYCDDILLLASNEGEMQKLILTVVLTKRNFGNCLSIYSNHHATPLNLWTMNSS